MIYIYTFIHLCMFIYIYIMDFDVCIYIYTYMCEYIFGTSRNLFHFQVVWYIMYILNYIRTSKFFKVLQSDLFWGWVFSTWCGWKSHLKDKKYVTADHVSRCSPYIATNIFVLQLPSASWFTHHSSVPPKLSGGRNVSKQPARRSFIILKKKLIRTIIVMWLTIFQYHCHLHWYWTILYWLVVGPPLWKIWVRQLGWWQRPGKSKIDGNQITNQLYNTGWWLGHPSEKY